ncbi:hypothetical protein PRIC1_009957 [Phytophthora ramorum]
MPMSKKAITKLIFNECKSEIMRFVDRATKSERNNIEHLVRFLGTVYALASLISINIHKLKSSSNILIQGNKKISDSREVEPAEALDDEEDPVETDPTEPVNVPAGGEPGEGSTSGGAALKDELITALKIVQTIAALKRVGITDDKTKTMLIEAFKFMNRTFADESIQLEVIDSA